MNSPTVTRSLSRLIAPEAVARVAQLIDGAHRIVITCHVSPDGDALGSSLALWHVLCSLGKEAAVVTPDTPLRQLQFMPGCDRVTVASRYPDHAASLFSKADLVFCLDFNEPSRLDKSAPLLTGSAARKVVVDHHLHPQIDADVVISHPESSSTSALIYRLLDDLGLLSRLNVDAAGCIYTGMMTDTGNFSYNSLDPDLYVIVADLVARGVDKDAIYDRVFNSTTESRLRLMSYALYAKLQLFPEHATALIALSKSELADFGYSKGDTESLVNVPLSLPGIRCSIFMRQDADDYVKVSTRSRGNFPVNKLCKLYFHGGGHLNAAGGEYRGTLDDAVNYVLELIARNAEPWNGQ